MNNLRSVKYLEKCLRTVRRYRSGKPVDTHQLIDGERILASLSLVQDLLVFPPDGLLRGS